ncbi:hypothetical protein [Frankia sp. QA3]|uniref:hypothetical protein n=1 Tax=Frankia sp. QA3 TaxID=710111 RepID=UPI000269BBAC|nr:hypothetical protein [Frankia sp. QA3]EIV91721.1 hypothetical protein FraQA3DRAFT_1186 [Frankia sp. QA3]
MGRRPARAGASSPDRVPRGLDPAVVDVVSVPAGLWARAAGLAPPAPDDPALHALPPQSGAVTVIVGAPGEPVPDIAAVAELLLDAPTAELTDGLLTALGRLADALPASARVRLRVVLPAGTPGGQALRLRWAVPAPQQVRPGVSKTESADAGRRMNGRRMNGRVRTEPPKNRRPCPRPAFPCVRPWFRPRSSRLPARAGCNW